MSFGNKGRGYHGFGGVGGGGQKKGKRKGRGEAAAAANWPEIGGKGGSTRKRGEGEKGKSNARESFPEREGDRARSV